MRCRSLARNTVSVLIVTVLISNFGGCSAAVPAIGLIGGGVATKALLNDLDDHATHIAQNAAAAGSLLTSKATRDVQLLIDAARQNLHDELNVQWDKLDGEKINLLREINTQLDKIETAGTQFGNLEDKVFLDTDSLVSSLPFASKMPRIRRVDGGSQYYKPDGTYDIRIISNVFVPFGPNATVTVADAPFPDVKPDTSDPSYGAILKIPAKTLEPYFDDFRLMYTTVAITVVGKKQQKSTFKVPIELFPRYPASYQLVQAYEAQEVDPSKTEIAPGKYTLVPGCGDSGCNAYWNICTDFPYGAQPIATVNQVDTFVGWGGFGAVTYGPSQACQVYWQHSHNVARNVKIDVSYHPLKPEIKHEPVNLDAIVIGGAKPICTKLNQDLKTMPLVQDQPAGLDIDKANVCWMQFGIRYSADFNPTMKGYTLAVHTFNSQNYSATEGAKDDKALEVVDTSMTNFKRAIIKLKEPSW
jgi:hypothetical protein